LIPLKTHVSFRCTVPLRSPKFSQIWSNKVIEQYTGYCLKPSVKACTGYLYSTTLTVLRVRNVGIEEIWTHTPLLKNMAFNRLLVPEADMLEEAKLVAAGLNTSPHDETT
jgi:hypothetical protein